MYSWQCAVYVAVLYISGVWSDSQFSITKCCPSGYGRLPNHTCIPYDTGPLTPQIHTDEGAIVETEVSGDENWDSICGKGQVLKQVYLGNNNTQLHQYGEDVLLLWLSTDYDSWMKVDPFCIAMATDWTTLSGQPEYLVEFCYQDPVLQWREDEIACQNKTCVRKCCPEGQILNQTCQIPHDEVMWKPIFHSRDNHSVTVQEPLDLLIVHGLPECPVSLIYDEYVILESGKVEVPGYDFDIYQTQYCIESFAEETGGTIDKLVLCHEHLTEDNRDCWWRHYLVDTLFMSISCVFMAITWLTYVCIPDLRMNTQGRCIISFITAIFVAFVTILVNSNYRGTFSSFGCSFSAVLSNLSILATFFWLNVLSYHIWDCLRSGKKRDEKKVFIAYSLYGWGCPLIVVLIGVVLDATKADVVRPDFLPPHCWFKDRITKWVYIYGFMLALLVVNLTFFLSSAIMVTRRLRQTHDIKHHSDGLWLFLKLFIIMGITWIIEMLTWLLEEDSCTTWVTVLDAINALHGVFVFLVTVIFRKDIRVLRWCCKRTKYDVDGTATSCTRDNFVELLDNQSK